MSGEQIEKHGEQRKKSLLELLPAWIAIATGVIFAAGFLVVLAFLDRFGIRESGADFWKVRYIHIGILCLYFPFVLNGTIFGLHYFIKNGDHDQRSMWQRSIPIGFLLLNFEVLCFTFLMFTDKLNAGAIAGLTPLLWILGLTVGGITVFGLIEKLIDGDQGKNGEKVETSETSGQAFTVITRWSLTVIVVVLDVWFFNDFWHTKGETQVNYILVYVCLCFFFAIALTAASNYYRKQSTRERSAAVMCISSAVLGPSLYLVIASFAYGVFQHIPATRGGGDFTNSPTVVVHFKPVSSPSTVSKLPQVLPAPATTKPLVLIEENSWGFYFADPTEADGPSKWKLIGSPSRLLKYLGTRALECL